MKKLTVNIVGPGAIGHLWAVYLLRANHHVSLFAPTASSAKIDRWQVDQQTESVALNINSFESWQPADLILICVKAHQLQKTCELLSQYLQQQPIKSIPIVLMMNGMGLLEIAQRYFSNHPIVVAYLTHGAYIKDRCLVHAGKGETRLGNLDLKNQVDQLKAFIPLLDQALPPVHWSDSHREDIFTKLLVNAVINPLTALSGQTNGSLVKNGELHQDAISLVKELQPLITLLHPRLKQEQIISTIKDVALATASNRSSMLQDISKQTKTEIDFINGYLVGLAKPLKIDLPLNIKLIQKIHQLEQKIIQDC